MDNINWSFGYGKEGFLRRKLAYLSLVVRSKQYEIFVKEIRPSLTDQIIDVGVTPNEELVDSNFFERKYKYPKNLLAVSVEDCKILRKKYPDIAFKEIKPYSRFPFKNNQFDILVSWATLEHAGTREQQKFFLSECLRVSKKCFITTPNRFFPFELHTNMFFVHWLPHKHFSAFCRLVGKDFWGDVRNLNLLSKHDLASIIQGASEVEILEFKQFSFFTSHFLIIKN